MSLWVGVMDNTDERLSAIEEAVSIAIKDVKLNVGQNIDRFGGESLGSHGNLHKLRGFAAHLEFDGAVPTREDSAAHYPLLRKVYDGELATKKFQHLIEHSDFDGYYLPIAFAEPISLVVNETVNSCGSSHQLLNELNQIGPMLFGDSFDDLKGPEILWTLDEFDPFVTEKFVWTRLRWTVRNANKHNLVISF